MKRFSNQTILLTAAFALALSLSVIAIIKVMSLQSIVDNLSKTVVQPPVPQTAVTQDETAGWKTYRNEQYGFEFQYPSPAKLRDLLTVVSIERTDFTTSGGKSVPDSALQFQVAVEDNPSHLSAQDFAWRFKERANDPNYIGISTPHNGVKYVPADAIRKGEETSVAGTAVYHIELFETQRAWDYIYVPYKDKIYILVYLTQFSADRSRSEEYKKIFEGILSTFKFIK